MYPAREAVRLCIETFTLQVQRTFHIVALERTAVSQQVRLQNAKKRRVTRLLLST